MPHSAFEIGLIYKERKDFESTRKWMKITIKQYSNYLTESMLKYRINYILNQLETNKIKF